jgi:hypothetical protein
VSLLVGHGGDPERPMTRLKFRCAKQPNPLRRKAIVKRAVQPERMFEY